LRTIAWLFLLSLIICCIDSKKEQQPKSALTPVIEIKLVPVKLKVHGKFKDKMHGEYIVNIPEGYEAFLFHTGGFSKPRFMAWGPDSVLHIANMNSGEIIALPDKNHDHVADTAIVAAKDAYGHDVKFFKKDMYVAEELKVEKFTDKDGDGIYETRSIFIDSILPGKQRPAGGHTTRTIVFDEINKKVYLSVGSSCNVCRETDRAVIFEFDLDGKNRKLFATGTRNCVGMAMNPHTNELWATNNGSDHQGNDIPPEWIDAVRKNGFYGFPFAYGNQEYFDFNAHHDYKDIPPITSADSILVKKMKPPAALIQAHSAPMAIEFSNNSFKNPFKNGAFVAYRGSWDRSPPTGYKVVYLHFDKNKKVTGVYDFITGFYQDNQKPWARPVGLETDLRGNLYMGSDDINEFIIVITPAK
jgi:glucose/arabinose dehydrogenase